MSYYIYDMSQLPSRLNNSDEEMGEITIPPPHSPTNGPALPRAYSRTQNPAVPYPPSTSSALPPTLKKWYSNDVFRTVTFFILMSAVLGISSTGWFMDKLSNDQMLGIFSSLLFLATPSPIQGKPKKKVYYVNQPPP